MSELNFLHEIESIITGLGYECVHVEVKSEFGRMKLQILLDTLGGINTGDCELVASHVSKYLDGSTDTATALDRGHYYLEVSSPGIERPLYKPADYSRFQGREARVRLSSPLEGRKTFTGIIQSADDTNLTLSVEGEDKIIPFEAVKGGNLVFRFDDKSNNSQHKKHRRKQ